MNVLSKPLPMSCWVNVRVYLMEKNSLGGSRCSCTPCRFPALNLQELLRSRNTPITFHIHGRNWALRTELLVAPPPGATLHQPGISGIPPFLLQLLLPSPLQKFPRSFGPHSTTPFPSPPFSNPLHLLRPPTGAGSFTDREAFRD